MSNGLANTVGLIVILLPQEKNMSEESQDEMMRILRKTSFDVVYQAIEDISTRRGFGETDVPAVNKALKDHGWTATEFVDGLILRMKRLDEDQKVR